MNVDRCEGRVRRLNGRQHRCGSSLLRMSPTGPVTVLAYDTSIGVIVGLCCAKKDAKASILARWPGAASWPVIEQEPDENRQRWMRHALSGPEPRPGPRVNGLMRYER